MTDIKKLMPVSTATTKILKKLKKTNDGDETVQTFTIKNDLRNDRYQQLQQNHEIKTETKACIWLTSFQFWF